MKSTGVAVRRPVGKAHILHRYVYWMSFFQCRFFNDTCSYDVMLSTNYITILNLSDFVPRIQSLGNQLQEVSFTVILTVQVYIYAFPNTRNPVCP